MTEFICLDVETTGLDKFQDSLIEFAAVRFNETEILDQYQTLIHFDGEIAPIIEDLTGINAEMLKSAPKLEEVKDKILEFCGDLPIMGHNIDFDIGFLKENDIEITGYNIDTLPLSHTVIENSQSYSLETLCAQYNTEYFPSHRALDDCLANVELLWYIFNEIQKFTPEQSYLWDQILKNTDQPLARLYEQITPKEKTEPIFKLQNELFEDTIQTTDQNEFTQEKSLKIDQINEGLIVTSKDPSENTTQLFGYGSYISTDLFKKELEQKHSINKMYFLLKVATQITKHETLNKAQLNLKDADHLYIKNIVIEDYKVPKSEKPYLTTHQTFFELNANNDLPNVNKLHFEYIPFLEEKFIRSGEHEITLQQAENGEESEELTILFGKFGMHVKKLMALAEGYYGGPLILPTLEANSDEFLNFLKDIKEITTNELTINNIEKLQSNSSKYLIWVTEYPSIGFIEKNINYDFKEILTNCPIPNKTVYLPDFDQNDFFVETSTNYPDSKSKDYLHYLLEEIQSDFENLKGHGLVIATSNALMKEMHEHLAIDFDQKGISLVTQNISGSKGKILHKIENADRPLILVCTQHFLMHFKPNLNKLEKAILAKIPMTLPNHPYYSYLRSKTQNDFAELTIPHAATVLYEICTQIQSMNPSANSLKLMDNRLLTTSWGQDIASRLPKNIILQSSPLQ